MVQISFVAADGRDWTVQGQAGFSVMQTALQANVPGIIGECGGSAACATCHVYVDPLWIGRLAPMAAHEDELLAFTSAERRETSRLGCQIKLEPALDGLTVAIPLSQT